MAVLDRAARSLLLSELLSNIHDLAAFVPLWMKNLRMRRALFLHGIDEQGSADRGLLFGGPHDLSAEMGPPEDPRDPATGPLRD